MMIMVMMRRRKLIQNLLFGTHKDSNGSLFLLLRLAVQSFAPPNEVPPPVVVVPPLDDDS